MALMVLALAVDARGQRLLETDGVELRGEAQLVMSGGGTCNVLESDTAYEANKANDGAPMDIWRLDFSVRNGSGRWLDHLIARYQIDSEWPDCTNWDGPDATEFAEFIEWADSIGHIQESGRNVVAPDQTLTQTKFFIVLRGDPEPRFANWSMDFDFAVNPPTATAGAGALGSPAPAPAATATAEQENLFWQSIMDSTNLADFEAYLAQFPNGVFRALAENRLEALRAPAGDSPTTTVRSAGDQPGTSRFNAEPPCAGQPEGAACWMNLDNQPECRIWNPNLQPDATVTWTGACSGGLPQGAGTLTWVWDSGQQTSESTGRLQEGERQGHWVERLPTGTVMEGPYVDGQRHGDWVIRFPTGAVYEGPVVADQKQGHWVERLPTGTVMEGPYVDGQGHGDWVIRFPTGTVYEGPAVAGQKQGHWVERYTDGTVREGSYVSGERHGEWVTRYTDGTVVVERYVNGVAVN